MKRILMISTHGYFTGNPSFGRADTGGQIVFVTELSKAIARNGFKVDILTRQFEDMPRIETLNDTVRIIRMPCGGNDFIPKEFLVHHLPDLIDEFVRYCRENDLSYQFIDAHYWDAGYAGMKLSEELSIPFVFTPHSLGIWKEMNTRDTITGKGLETDEQQLESQFNFKERNRTEREIMQRASMIVATTPEQKSVIKEQYGIAPGKTAVIPPGFFPEKYYRMDEDEIIQVREKFCLPDRYILSVGRIAENKGYDLLIKAFREVVDAVRDIRLVFAIGSNEKADEKKRERLAAIARDLELTENIVLLGHVKELNILYNTAEILVMPSTYEPFGMVAIEGMACRAPAVITNLGGLKDYLEDGKDALFTNPLDTSGMAADIIRLLQDKDLREKIAETGCKKAYSLFTWDKITDTTLNLISGW